MTNKIIQGVLLDSSGSPISGAKIRFVSTATKSVLNSVETDYHVGSDGAYNFSVQFGIYTIQICRSDEVQFRTVCANTYVFDTKLLMGAGDKLVAIGTTGSLVTATVTYISIA